MKQSELSLRCVPLTKWKLLHCVGCEFYLTWLWMCWSIDLCIDGAVLGGLCFPARAIYEWFSPFTSLIFQSTLDLMAYCWFFKSDWLLCTTVVLISPHSAVRISANSVCISSVCSFMLKITPIQAAPKRFFNGITQLLLAFLFIAVHFCVNDLD